MILSSGLSVLKEKQGNIVKVDNKGRNISKYVKVVKDHVQDVGNAVAAMTRRLGLYLGTYNRTAKKQSDDIHNLKDDHMDLNNRMTAQQMSTSSHLADISILKKELALVKER